MDVSACQVPTKGYPLFRMRADARVEAVGRLEPLAGDACRLHVEGDRPNLIRLPEGEWDHFPGLPWYLDDLRIDGFLGRAFAASHVASGLPRDLTQWHSGHASEALLRGISTGCGALLLGERAVEVALVALDAPPDLVCASQRATAYDQRATSLARGDCPHPGPGGQQPKFTSTVEHAGGRYAALVKFALPGAGEAAERWADLLTCEHLALEVLRDAGVSAAVSTVIQTDQHTFLEVQRFDRSPDTLGRHGFVSLLALSSAFVGDVTIDWGLAGEHLLAQRWIDQDAAAGMARLHAFGRLIGNSDMHHGNIGFHLGDQGPLPLAPAYDVLPMSLAPSRTGVLRATTPIGPIAPTRAGQLAHLQWAAPLAADFWERVAGSPMLRSELLRQVALENARRVEAMGQCFG